MAQHRRATSSGQDSTVYLYLQDSGHSFSDEDVHILDRKEHWFERGVKEAIYVKKERPSLNQGGDLRNDFAPVADSQMLNLVDENGYLSF